MNKYIETIEILSKKYWYILVILYGLLLIFGSIFKWKWIVQTKGDKPFGFMYWTYNFFGEKGYRIATAIIGLFLILLTIVMVILFNRVVQ